MPFDTQTIVLIALTVLAAETLLLVLVAGRRGTAARLTLLLNGLSGLFLLLALRAALGGDGNTVVAWLAAALLAHLGDLYVRLTRF